MDQIIQDLDSLKLSQDQQGITGFIYSDETLKHSPLKKKHVENPQRQEAVVYAINNNVIQKLQNKSIVEVISEVQPCDIQHILQVHPQDYIDLIEGMFEPIEGMPQKELQWFTDSYITKHSPNAARICIQELLTAVDKVVNNQWKNAFVVSRPPGHHAGNKLKPNGFCIYNNVAIAAKYARKQYGIKKIAIFDWDVHHGNGTQDIFYEDPDTLFISLHQFDEGYFFPRTGFPNMTGDPQKAPFMNVNVGWNLTEDEQPGDNEYVYAQHRLLEPILRTFEPEIIFISAGYDAAKNDPVGNCELTKLGYAYLTQNLMQICPKIIATLEGGYNINQTAICAQETFLTLIGKTEDLNKFVKQSKPNKVGINAVNVTLEHQKEYWKILESQNLVNYSNSFVGQESMIIAGGHKSAFKVEGNTLIKQAKLGEKKFYEELMNENSPYAEENKILVQEKLIPDFCRIENDTIIMGNLMTGLENGSVIDFKLGKITHDIYANEEKKKQENSKAIISSQGEFGLRMSGLKIKDSEGKLIKNATGQEGFKMIRSRDDIKKVLLEVLKSNEADIPQELAIQKSLKFLDKMIDFVKNKTKRYFRSSSFLLIVDNISKKSETRWIDFNHQGPLPEGQAQDDNLLQPLVLLREIFKELDD